MVCNIATMYNENERIQGYKRLDGSKDCDTNALNSIGTGYVAVAFFLKATTDQSIL
jgi:hypothetical protein